MILKGERQKAEGRGQRLEESHMGKKQGNSVWGPGLGRLVAFIFD